MYNQTPIKTNGVKPLEISSSISQAFTTYGIPRHGGKPIFLDENMFVTIPLDDYYVSHLVKQ